MTTKAVHELAPGLDTARCVGHPTATNDAVLLCQSDTMSA